MKSGQGSHKHRVPWAEQSCSPKNSQSSVAGAEEAGVDQGLRTALLLRELWMSVGVIKALQVLSRGEPPAVRCKFPGEGRNYQGTEGLL